MFTGRKVSWAYLYLVAMMPLFFRACGHKAQRWLPLLVVAGSCGVAKGQNLTVTAQIPSVNALTAPVSSNVSLTFDQALNPSAATLGSLHVFSSQRGGLSRQGQGATVSTSGPTLTLDPAIDFRPGETVFVTATTAAEGSDGATLARGRAAQFTTAVGGSGRGNFGTGPAINYAVADQPLRLVLGDVDNDGDLDMMVIYVNSGNVSVNLNHGDGTFDFKNAGNYPVGIAPLGVALGDVDRDGDLDIVVSDVDNSTVSVRFNQGDGTFGSRDAVNYQVEVRPLSVVLGDLDADGDLDMVVSSDGNRSVSVHLNQGNGTFGSGVNYQVLDRPISVVLGDVDADGDLDIVVASLGDDSINVLFNQSDGTFGSGPPTSYRVGFNPFEVVLGDVDADGDLDIVTVNNGSYDVGVCLNQGNGIFDDAVNYLVGKGPTSVVLGDVDADGDLDIITANRDDNTVSIRLNQGSGTFGSGDAVNYRVGGGPWSVALVDADADGDLDILTANRDDNSVSVRFNQSAMPLAAAPVRVAAASALYPNPARAGQVLRAEGLPAGTTVTLRDMLGRTIPGVAGAAVPLDGLLRLPLPATLAPGLYLLQAGGYTWRVVVE